MRGGDQFFGVGAGFILETGGEAVGLIGEHARPRRDVTLAVLAEPLVTRRGATRYRHFASPLSIAWPTSAPAPAPSSVPSNPEPPGAMTLPSTPPPSVPTIPNTEERIVGRERVGNGRT